MHSIALPKKISFTAGEESGSEVVVIEPLYPGYGTTLGNALRRALLSSLPGAAVVGIKIKGADHEFMALPNIKEDVLEIALNLKTLALRVHSDEVVRLELEVHGEKIVTAADIKASSDVEVVNQDLVLAHITDPAGSLVMEIFVSKGMGYETIENREKRNKEIGYIDIDSIFSPVLGIGITVENTRVGKMTNWDKLTLKIITNGSISAAEAFEQAAAILVEQFQSLIALRQSLTDGELTAGAAEIEETKTATEVAAAEAIDLAKLAREELNVYAKEHGIANPEEFKTKGKLIEELKKDI